MQIRRVLETALYVDDLVAAEAFYCQVLGLTPLARETGRHCFFRLDRSMLLLFNPCVTDDAPDSDIPPHGARGAGHVAFAVELAEIDGWATRLAAHGVTIERDIHWPGGGRSLFFRDPSGNSLEVATPTLWGLEPGG